MAAINAVYAPSHSAASSKLVVGSIKSNVGHLEAAAALAGLVKTVLALEHAQIPPQMHFSTPNQKIDFSSVIIPAGSVHAWPSVRRPGEPRRAAINSFGFGGTNGHAVLEEFLVDERRKHEAEYSASSKSSSSTSLFPPAPLTPPSSSPSSAFSSSSLTRFATPTNDPEYGHGRAHKRPYLFKLSAATDTILAEMAENISQYIEAKQPRLADLSHTLLARRSTLKKVAFLVAETGEELAESLRKHRFNIVSREEQYQGGGIAFVFTGQGAQW